MSRVLLELLHGGLIIAQVALKWLKAVNVLLLIIVIKCVYMFMYRKCIYQLNISENVL